MRWLRPLSLLLPCVGLYIAGYLSVYKAMGLDAACGATMGCSQVAVWVDQNMGGFPFAYLGVFGYIVLFLNGLVGLILKKPMIKTGLVISGLGALASVGLMIVSFFVIKAQCLWCIGSAVTMVATFGTYLGMNSSPPDPKPEPTDFGFAAFGFLAALLGLSLSISQALGMIPATVKGTIADYIPQNPKVYGDPNAPVTIVEFFSFTCGHCKESYPHVKALIDASKGKARLVMVHFPFLNREDHAMSAPAAAASEMAHEKGKFFEFANAIYEIPTKDLDANKIAQCAANVGLDPEAVRKRMQDSQDSSILRVTADMKISADLGIQITPTFLVGRKGERVDVFLQKQLIPGVTGVRYGLTRPPDL